MSNGSKRPGPKAYLLITLFALLLVLFPFLFWYYTWFGRPLTAGDLDRYFADTSKPRHAQHALVQLSDRLARHENVSRWYPQVIRQSTSSNLELRESAAWVMGQDPTYAPFHEALLRLIHDSQPMVRRNAAPALAAFGDAAARPELVDMLRPYTVHAPAGGKLKYRLKPGESGFTNLFLAGDWTANGLNVGAVESAALSGMEAARAICGKPHIIPGETDL